MKYQEEFIASIFAGVGSQEFYEQDIKKRSDSAEVETKKVSFEDKKQLSRANSVEGKPLFKGIRGGLSAIKKLVKAASIDETEEEHKQRMEKTRLIKLKKSEAFFGQFLATPEQRQERLLG